jgi:hypothetical protein
MNDRDVVDAFVAYLKERGYPDLRVERRPDTENRTAPEIDAVAGPFRIEHTRIDTLPNQRRHSDWFVRAAGGLEREFRDNPPPFRLRITLEYDAVGKGQDWPEIRAALMNWVTKQAPLLTDGNIVVDSSRSIPFRLHVAKASERRHGVFFARFVPDDDSLAARVKEILGRKAEKLGKYQTPGATTVLLIENDDIALMNEETLIEAIRTAFPAGMPLGLDQLWYADTCIADAVDFRELTAELRQSAV